MTESDIELMAIEQLEGMGYPPDMALLATETVLEQAEQLADELSAAWANLITKSKLKWN